MYKKNKFFKINDILNFLNKKRELLTNEEYNAILSILSPELFEEIDYNEAIQINRVLITLPFAQASLSS